MGFKDYFDAGAGSERNPEFKPKEGTNTVRVLDDPTVIVTRFEGKKFVGVCFEGAPYCADIPEGSRLNKKWQTWVIDRADGQIKLYYMPYTVAKEIRGYLDNPEYTFNSFPMPYDITITVKNAGTFDAEYSVLPARKETPLTVEELEMFKDKTSCAVLVNKAKEKAKKEWEDSNAIQLDEEPKDRKPDYPTDYPTEINPYDIPF